MSVNPANAILNYLYAILESESRLALAALGLDPGIGVLHSDLRGRDSLAADLMEPVRPKVDELLLNLLRREQFRREWFFEVYLASCGCQLRGVDCEVSLGLQGPTSPPRIPSHETNSAPKK